MLFGVNLMRSRVSYRAAQSCKPLSVAVDGVVYERYFGVKAVMRYVWKRLLVSEVVWQEYDQPAVVAHFR